MYTWQIPRDVCISEVNKNNYKKCHILQCTITIKLSHFSLVTYINTRSHFTFGSHFYHGALDLEYWGGRLGAVVFMPSNFQINSKIKKINTRKWHNHINQLTYWQFYYKQYIDIEVSRKKPQNFQYQSHIIVTVIVIIKVTCFVVCCQLDLFVSSTRQ